MGKDIFLSYARADHERAEQIKELLEGLGLTVFFDVEGLDAGDVFPDIIDREVKSASAVVGVWSKHAFTREWVKKECDIGRLRNVLVPVIIEEMGPLDRPAAFHDIQYNDLSDFNGDPGHAGWLRFIKSLARVLQRPELLERENAAQNAIQFGQNSELERELAAVREQISEMRSTKEQLAASVRDAQSHQTATNLELWREIKDTDNAAALRRFLETVRNTPLEHLVEAKLDALGPVETPAKRAAPVSSQSGAEPHVSAQDVIPEPPAPPNRTVTPAPESRKNPIWWVIAAIFSVGAIGAFASAFLFDDVAMGQTNAEEILVQSCLGAQSTEAETCSCMAELVVENLDPDLVEILLGAAKAEDADAYMMSKMVELSPEEMTSYMTVMMRAANECGTDL